MGSLGFVIAPETLWMSPKKRPLFKKCERC